MSNLLDKSSIVLTPTAYNNGKVLCVKPSDGSGDFDFSRNSAATRVNAQGLVEDVQILSSNLVQNGSFSEQGAEEVTNGNFSQQGSQLITNGDFATDSDWTKGTGWSISGGSANCDGSQSGNADLIQGISTIAGKQYKISYTISNYSDGNIKVRLSSGNTTSTQSSNGTFTEIITAAISGGFRLRGNDTFIGSIDNCSVVEVGQDWTFTSGATLTALGAKITHTPTAGQISQVNSLVIGKNYKFTYEITQSVSGGLKLNSAVNTPMVTSIGVHTKYFEADLTGFTIARLSAINNDVTITNISVKEVGQDWTLGTGWSIGDNKAIALNAAFGSQLIDSTTLTASKKYSISFNISNYVKGSVRIGVGNAFSSDVSSNGDYTFILTAVNTNAFKVQTRSGGSGTSLSITNISVIEITEDTNLPRINYEGFSFDGSGNIIPDSGCGSWLFEPQSTNLITYSEDFTNGWINTGTTDTISTQLSPNGLNYSTLLVGDVATASTKRIRNTVTTTASTSNTFSVFVKSANRTFIQIIISGDAQGYANFDVSNGIVGNKGSKTTANITPFNNDWYRCEVSTDATTNNGAFMIYLVDSNTASFGSSGTSTDGVYIWGAQLEEQSFATSYIPTSGTSVTRNQDLCTNGGSASLINSTEGVLYAEIAKLSNIGNCKFGLFGNSTSKQLRLEISNSIIRAQLFNGSYQANMPSTQVVTDNNKIAFKYKENDFALWINGVEVATDNSGVTFNADELFKFNLVGQNNIVTPFFGKTKCLAVWKEALTSAELQELTTI